VFLVNSRFSLVSAAPPRFAPRGRSPGEAPLLPKLRGHFAEFLDHGSLDRLGILYLTTCVGFGYGPRQNSLEAFLGSIGSATSPHRLGIGSQALRGGFANHAPYLLTPGQPSPGLAYLPASPHHLPTTGSGHHLHPAPPKRNPASAAQHPRPRHGRPVTGTGISTRSPSTTPVGLALGPDSPWAEQPGPGTLGHPAAGIPTLLSLLMPEFSLAPRPPHPSEAASPTARRSPTHPRP